MWVDAFESFLSAFSGYISHAEKNSSSFVVFHALSGWDIKRLHSMALGTVCLAGLGRKLRSRNAYVWVPFSVLIHSSHWNDIRQYWARDIRHKNVPFSATIHEKVLKIQLSLCLQNAIQKHVKSSILEAGNWITSDLSNQDIHSPAGFGCRKIGDALKQVWMIKCKRECFGVQIC